MSSLTSSSGGREAFLSTTPPDVDDFNGWLLYWRHIRDLYLADYTVNNDRVWRIQFRRDPLYRFTTDKGKIFVMSYDHVKKTIYVKEATGWEMTIKM